MSSKATGPRWAIKTSLVSTQWLPLAIRQFVDRYDIGSAGRQRHEGSGCLEKKAADEKAAAYKIQAEQIAAEQAKHMPTKRA